MTVTIEPADRVVHAEIEAVLAEIEATPWPDDIAEARRLMDEMAPPLAGDIMAEPVALAGCRGQILIPPDCEKDRAILFLHGGGYVYGSLKSHAGMAGELARAARGKVYQLDYRLAPEHPFPAALQDACAAYGWLRQTGYAAAGIAIVGDSAGGGLVMSTLLALRGRSEELPDAAVCISPWVDLEATGASFSTRRQLDPMIDRRLVGLLAGIYANGADLRDPLISPIHADLRGLPRLLIQVGEREVLFSEAETLARHARLADIDVTFEEWSDMVHVWHLFFPRLSDGRAAIARAGAFIAKSATSQRRLR
jgi:acetyl esterase/lipase